MPWFDTCHVIGKGMSWNGFREEQLEDTIYTCNHALFRLLKKFQKQKVEIDLAFWMDDFKYLQPDLIKQIIDTNVPVMTSHYYPEMMDGTKIVAYPIAEHIARFGTSYSASTIGWMIAYSVLKEYRTIHLWGTDHRRKKTTEYLHELECSKFWIGAAVGAGWEVINHSQIFFKEFQQPHTQMYGYNYELWRHSNLEEEMA